MQIYLNDLGVSLYGTQRLQKKARSVPISNPAITAGGVSHRNEEAFNLFVDARSILWTKRQLFAVWSQQGKRLDFGPGRRTPSLGRSSLFHDLHLFP